MDRFRGSAPASVDDKGRLKIPNLFRERIREAYGPDLFVSSLHGREVLIYPMAEWRTLEERLAASPAIHRAKKKFLERVNFFGQDAEMDSQGRVLIPALLREAVHFDGEVVVTGNINHLVVTERKATADRISAEDFTAEDYDELSKLLL
jgi:transcriptional regulator MraZ